MLDEVFLNISQPTGSHLETLVMNKVQSEHEAKMVALEKVNLELQSQLIQLVD